MSKVKVAMAAVIKMTGGVAVEIRIEAMVYVTVVQAVVEVRNPS